MRGYLQAKIAIISQRKMPSFKPCDLSKTDKQENFSFELREIHAHFTVK